MTADEIRESFLNFFKSKGHVIVPSAPMVIKDDPTLMFTNAGMNQFKDIILGNRPAIHKRCADAQKCLRVSGKHNDLEEVGHDTYHHTMFEMLGNWSFGDYFKKEAIGWAWEYLTSVLKIDPNILYATVFEGAPDEGLARDDEAAAYWGNYLPEDRIINGNKHDNFWEMGATGPCGPCSEIHIDLRSAEERKQTPGRELVNKDNPQVIEIWNLVFMQYNRKADFSLEPLPAKVIDTGMGFERLCAVLQGKRSNYDTDVFQPLIQAIAERSGCRYGDNDETDVAMRVVADHLRTIAFAIADGQLPGNAKAGYVIRRILRRAVRYAYTFLQQKNAFMYTLLPVLVQQMGKHYPELESQKVLIAKVIKEEEDAFLRTLDTGMRLLERVINEAKQQNRAQISGVQAFMLFDTYGFPLDLTELICRENGLTADEKVFADEMQKQKQRARNAAVVTADDWTILAEGETQFVGWDVTQCPCRILKYRKVTQKKKTYWQIVLDKTPFYAEMGGQTGDKGALRSDTEVIDIVDTKRENNLPVHIAKQIPAHPDALFTASVNEPLRRACEANHTCTHLIDQALRQVLGTHVEQKGSLVTPDYLRFDFSHFQKVTADQLHQVERLVNARIRQDIPLQEYRDMPIDEARKLGAIALFGEKYGARVRVVCFGDSIELCGGCHAKSTGRLGMMKILTESSVAAGIRRIEAITGEKVEEMLYAMQDLTTDIRALFNNAPDVKTAIRKAIDENANLKQQLEATLKEKAAQIKADVIARARIVNGVTLFRSVFPLSPDLAKDMAFQLRTEADDTLVILGSIAEGKPTLTAAASDNMVKTHHIHVGKLIREAAKLIQGGGGGQPHFATAGGKNPDGLSAALDKFVELAQL